MLLLSARPNGGFYLTAKSGEVLGTIIVNHTQAGQVILAFDVDKRVDITRFKPHENPNLATGIPVSARQRSSKKRAIEHKRNARRAKYGRGNNGR